MKITTIKAISRASVKIKDSFYTVEYGEERTLDDTDNVDEEREKLWIACNGEIDRQLEDIVNSFR